MFQGVRNVSYSKKCEYALNGWFLSGQIHARSHGQKRNDHKSWTNIKPLPFVSIFKINEKRRINLKKEQIMELSNKGLNELSDLE